MEREQERERKRLRMANVVRKELWAILQQDIADERFGFFTITAVKMSGDFRKATVTVSLMGDPARRKEALAALAESNRHIRHLLAQRMNARFVPDLEFVPDDGSSVRIEEILREIHDDRT